MDDQYALDIEYHFTDGDVLYQQLIEGRDSAEHLNNMLRLVINVSPTETVTYIAREYQLNYTKVTRRKLEPQRRPAIT